MLRASAQGGRGPRPNPPRRDDGADEPPHTLQSYVAAHYTLMLAYARAGASTPSPRRARARATRVRRAGVQPMAPAPAAPESADTDSTDYVQAATAPQPAWIGCTARCGRSRWTSR